MIETVPHDDNKDITVFLRDKTNLELELNRSDHKSNKIDVEYSKVDELKAIMDETQSPSSNGMGCIVSK